MLDPLFRNYDQNKLILSLHEIFVLFYLRHIAKTIRIYHEGWIDKSVLRITVWHHELAE